MILNTFQSANIWGKLFLNRKLFILDIFSGFLVTFFLRFHRTTTTQCKNKAFWKAWGRKLRIMRCFCWEVFNGTWQSLFVLLEKRYLQAILRLIFANRGTRAPEGRVLFYFLFILYFFIYFFIKSFIEQVRNPFRYPLQRYNSLERFIRTYIRLVARERIDC